LPLYARVRKRQILRTVYRRSFYELGVEGAARILCRPGHLPFGRPGRRPFPDVRQKLQISPYGGCAPRRAGRTLSLGREAKRSSERPPREARRACMRKMGLLLAALVVGLAVASGAAGGDHKLPQKLHGHRRPRPPHREHRFADHAGPRRRVTPSPATAATTTSRAARAATRSTAARATTGSWAARATTTWRATSGTTT
jgi:hypothetical protein